MFNASLLIQAVQSVQLKMVRITSERVKKWAIQTGIYGVSLGILLFVYLSSIDAIQINSYSGNQTCLGNDYDPCYATINFTPRYDIFIYPSKDWAKSLPFSTDKKIDKLIIQRKWGSGWRTLDFNKTCNGAWCGCYWCNKYKHAKYSYVFRKGKTYVIRFKGYKGPTETIKWGFGKIDPLWEGVKTIPFYVKTFSHWKYETERYPNGSIKSRIKHPVYVDEKLLKVEKNNVTIITPANFRCYYNGGDSRICKTWINLTYNRASPLDVGKIPREIDFKNREKVKNSLLKIPSPLFEKGKTYVLKYEVEYTGIQDEVNFTIADLFVDPTISGCTTINSAGEYNLSGDIIDSTTSKCIYINSTGVTLDCGGHLIDGDDTADYGIYDWEENGNIIKNCRLSDWDTAAIGLRQTSSYTPFTLSNLTITSVPDYGIYGEMLVSLGDFTDITIDGSGDYGIYCYDDYSGCEMNLTNINLWNVRAGISLAYAYDNILKNIQGNTSYGGGEEFISLSGSTDYPNSLENISLKLASSSYGILVVGPSTQEDNNFIRNIYIQTDGSGMKVEQHLTDIDNITIDSSGGDICLEIQPNNDDINNLSLKGCNKGIYAYYKFYKSNLTNSTIEAADYGVYLPKRLSGDYVVEGNWIYNNIFNATIGFYVEKDENTTIGDFNTTKTAGTNIVNGSYLGGNAWLKPDSTGFSQTCTDSDNDDICDDIYNMTNGTTIAVDYLPLKYNASGGGGTSSCSCPGLNNNWQIDMSDNCDITVDCNIGNGNITFINTGYFNCKAQITAHSMENPSTGQKINVYSSCKLRFS